MKSIKKLSVRTYNNIYELFITWLSNKAVLAFIVGLAFSLPYLLLALATPSVRLVLVLEDGLIESLGAVFYAFAFLTMLYNYAHSTRATNNFFNWATKHNIWFLLLAIVLFVCLGEELSWGQRIFGWQTPQSWAELNAQHETNVHNLWMTHYEPVNGPKINLNRLLTLFGITYSFILPILIKSFKRCRSLSDWLGLPVPSFMVGSLFLVSWISFKIVVYVFDVGQMDLENRQGFEELKETCEAAVFFVLALYFAFDRITGYSPK